MKQTVIFVDDEEELRHATRQTRRRAERPAGVREKARSAATVVISKYVIGAPPLVS